jgi:hypothetical protein
MRGLAVSSKRRSEDFPLSVVADPCGTILRLLQESMRPMKITSLVLLNGIAALAMLTGCSKPAEPPPAATTTEDSADRSAAPPPPSYSEKAATLLKFIDARPECQPFRAPLEQASAAPARATEELNMVEILEQAHKAGCQKDPG